MSRGGDAGVAPAAEYKAHAAANMLLEEYQQKIAQYDYYAILGFAKRDDSYAYITDDLIVAARKKLQAITHEDRWNRDSQYADVVVKKLTSDILISRDPRVEIHLPPALIPKTKEMSQELFKRIEAASVALGSAKNRAHYDPAAAQTKARVVSEFQKSFVNQPRLQEYLEDEGFLELFQKLLGNGVLRREQFTANEDAPFLKLLFVFSRALAYEQCSFEAIKRLLKARHQLKIYFKAHPHLQAFLNVPQILLALPRDVNALEILNPASTAAFNLSAILYLFNFIKSSHSKKIRIDIASALTGFATFATNFAKAEQQSGVGLTQEQRNFLVLFFQHDGRGFLPRIFQSSQSTYINQLKWQLIKTTVAEYLNQPHSLTSWNKLDDNLAHIAKLFSLGSEVMAYVESFEASFKTLEGIAQSIADANQDALPAPEPLEGEPISEVEIAQRVKRTLEESRRVIRSTITEFARRDVNRSVVNLTVPKCRDKIKQEVEARLKKLQDDPCINQPRSPLAFYTKVTLSAVFLAVPAAALSIVVKAVTCALVFGFFVDTCKYINPFRSGFKNMFFRTNRRAELSRGKSQLRELSTAEPGQRSRVNSEPQVR